MMYEVYRHRPTLPEASADQSSPHRQSSNALPSENRIVARKNKSEVTAVTLAGRYVAAAMPKEPEQQRSAAVIRPL